MMKMVSPKPRPSADTRNMDRMRLKYVMNMIVFSTCECLFVLAWQDDTPLTDANISLFTSMQEKVVPTWIKVFNYYINGPMQYMILFAAILSGAIQHYDGMMTINFFFLLYTC